MSGKFVLRVLVSHTPLTAFCKHEQTLLLTFDKKFILEHVQIEINTKEKKKKSTPPCDSCATRNETLQHLQATSLCTFH